MPKARIVIADSKDNSRRNLKDLLIRSAYQVQAEARNAPDLLRKVRSLLPDLVIMDSNLEGGSIMEIAGIIENDNLSSVLILTEKLKSQSVADHAHIIKPYADETLFTVIDVCLMYSDRVRLVQKEVDKLQDKLYTRKLLEKAKGIIMKNLEVDEEEAYRLMQKQSMDHSISLKNLANAIIAAEDNKSLK